jgi:hypothetical protein
MLHENDIESSKKVNYPIAFTTENNEPKDPLKPGTIAHLWLSETNRLYAHAFHGSQALIRGQKII